MKKTLSLALALVLIVCSFASCEYILGYDPSELMTAADAALENAEYTVNTTVVFTSDNEEMKAAISSFGNAQMTFQRKGDSSRATATMRYDGATVEKGYLITSGMLYYTLSTTKNGTMSKVKEKVNITDSEKAMIINDVGMSSPLSFADFSDVKVESSGNVFLITCSDIKTNIASALAGSVKNSLGVNGAVVSVSDAELQIRLVDGKYNGEYISIAYKVEIDGKTYDLGMQLSREYDTTTPVEIVFPADADLYTQTTYLELTK